MHNLNTELKCFLSQILAIFIPAFALRRARVEQQISLDRPVWMDDEFELS